MFSTINNRIRRISVNLKRFGFIKTIKYLFYNGIIKRPLNRTNYFLKCEIYPQNIIFITSLPKSGSTWLSNMCAEINGFSLFAPSSWNTYISKEWKRFTNLGHTIPIMPPPELLPLGENC